MKITTPKTLTADDSYIGLGCNIETNPGLLELPLIEN